MGLRCGLSHSSRSRAAVNRGGLVLAVIVAEDGGYGERGWIERLTGVEKYFSYASWRTRSTIWTDGSRFDTGGVGAACTWKHTSRFTEVGEAVDRGE